MIEYKPFEMHSHTLHSDGSFTVKELCHACKGRDLAGVLLTDHNTMSGFDDITPELEQETVPVIRGIEWTTFYGHMLVIGAERFVDWRKATPENIDRFTRQIQEAQGAVGVAHPYALGSPFCTGCHWEFDVKEWQHINYIEVWSGSFPVFEPCNDPGFQMWTDLLNRGHRLAATSGRDWHGPDKDQPQHMPATYLGIEGGLVSTKTAREALKAGRVYVSGGPEISLSLHQKGQVFSLGGAMAPGEADLGFTLDHTRRLAQWQGFGLKARKAEIIQNGAPVLSLPLSGEGIEHLQAHLLLWPGWLRLDIMGDYMGGEDQLLAFTSPVYVKSGRHAASTFT